MKNILDKIDWSEYYYVFTDTTKEVFLNSKNPIIIIWGTLSSSYCFEKKDKIETLKYMIEQYKEKKKGYIEPVVIWIHTTGKKQWMHMLLVAHIIDIMSLKNGEPVGHNTYANTRNKDE